MTIRDRFILLILLVTSGIAISVITIQNTQMREHLLAGQQEWVNTLVRAIAEGVAQDTIDGNRLKTRRRMRRIVSSDKALAYIYITDFEGRLFTHTFESGFPRVLADRLHAGDHDEAIFFTAENVEIQNIVAPLIDGMEAHLHIGVNQEEINALVEAARDDLIQIVGVISAVGLVIALLIGTRISRPLITLTEQIQHFGQDKRDTRLKLDTTEPNIVRLIAVFNEMFEERAHAEDALRRSQKMEAIGNLTGGIAHDFNNMLGIVLGNLELAQLDSRVNTETRERLGNALLAAERGAELTKKLLGFARTRPGGTKLTLVNNVVSNIEKLITKSLTAEVYVEKHLADDLWLTDIDPAELEDALLNLALNARDAMPGGGTLAIETSNKVLDDEYVRLNPGSHCGGFVMIAVSDTGTGMSQDIQEKVFEPFFTTKEKGKGTGLGLSMVYGFVQRSSGHIKLYSEPTSGTTFRIFLPRADGNIAQEENTTALDQDMPRGTETILVVDDEEALTDIAVTRLEGLGYHVLTAFNGRQALEILKDNTNIDLLFTDIIMPGELDGYRLALAAAELRPTVKILLTSGFTDKRERLVNGNAEFIAKLTKCLLSKPYNYTELAMAVRDTLDQ